MTTLAGLRLADAASMLAATAATSQQVVHNRSKLSVGGLGLGLGAETAMESESEARLGQAQCLFFFLTFPSPL